MFVQVNIDNCVLSKVNIVRLIFGVTTQLCLYICFQPTTVSIQLIFPMFGAADGSIIHNITLLGKLP